MILGFSFPVQSVCMCDPTAVELHGGYKWLVVCVFFLFFSYITGDFFL